MCRYSTQLIHAFEYIMQLTHCGLECHVALEILVIIGSGNGFTPNCLNLNGYIYFFF